ncbi:MAG: DnaA regulatory inactivator Hda [Pseudomonadota bacterium]
MKQLLLDIAAPSLPTLDNFVAGTAGSNAELLRALRAMAMAGAAERFVYLWGEAGAGKSHLLQATVALARSHGMDAVYFSCAAQPEFDTTVRLVAADDVQRLDEAAQVALFNRYNSLRENDGMLLASGDAPPAQLNLRADLVTRLGWGLVYRVQGLSDTEKIQALQRHAQDRGFDLKQEVAEYLLRHYRRDLPALMAVLDALDRYSLETKRPITLPLLREAL